MSLSNYAVEQTDGSYSLAAAAHRGRSATRPVYGFRA